MARFVTRLFLNGVTLGALLFVLVSPSPVRADVQINCDNGDGYYSRSAPMNSTFTCAEPQPPHQVTCQIGTQYCTWTCVNGGVTDVSCSFNWCYGEHGNITCCDHSCRF
jgi:hypothetical protein